MTQSCVCTSVRKANRALFRLYEEALEDSGVTVTQFSILRDLEDKGATPLSRLAEGLVMERTSLYRTISPLEKSGAISIKPGPHGKVRIAKLTAKGKAQLKRATPAWQGVQTRIVEAMGVDKWAELSHLLHAIPALTESLTHDR